MGVWGAMPDPRIIHKNQEDTILDHRKLEVGLVRDPGNREMSLGS